MKTIVEVDGITHSDDDAYRNDLRRQRDLESSGFMVIRFFDAEILNRISEAFREWIRCVMITVAHGGNVLLSLIDFAQPARGRFLS